MLECPDGRTVWLKLLRWPARGNAPLSGTVPLLAHHADARVRVNKRPSDSGSFLESSLNIDSLHAKKFLNISGQTYSLPAW